MSANLYDDIVRLDVTTRLQLAQDLLDSVPSGAFSLPVTEEQHGGLPARLAYHRANQEEETVSLTDIEAKLRL